MIRIKRERFDEANGRLIVRIYRVYNCFCSVDEFRSSNMCGSPESARKRGMHKEGGKRLYFGRAFAEELNEVFQEAERRRQR